MEPLLPPPLFPAAPFCWLGFPCPPRVCFCVEGVGFRLFLLLSKPLSLLPPVAYRAQVGRLGGSRWGWVL